MKRHLATSAVLAVALIALTPVTAANAAPTLSPSLGGYVAAGDTAAFSVGLSDVTWTDVLVTIELPIGTINVDDAGLALSLQPGYSSFSDVAEVAFTGSLADVTTALAERLTWTAPATPAESFLRLSITVAPFVSGLTFNPDNGHFYIAPPETYLTWVDARDAAAAMTYNGLNGYLATITSQEENNFVANYSGGADIWFGATSELDYVNPLLPAEEQYVDDNDIQGDWYWGTGPEAGTLFSEGLGSPVTVPGQYASWAPDEPNDAGFERCAVTNWSFASGLWNDLACDGYLLRFVVEFGGIGTEGSALHFENLNATGPVIPGTDAPAQVVPAALPATGMSPLVPASIAAVMLLAGLLFVRRGRATV